MATPAPPRLKSRFGFGSHWSSYSSSKPLPSPPSSFPPSAPSHIPSALVTETIGEGGTTFPHHEHSNPQATFPGPGANSNPSRSRSGSTSSRPGSTSSRHSSLRRPSGTSKAAAFLPAYDSGPASTSFLPRPRSNTNTAVLPPNVSSSRDGSSSVAPPALVPRTIPVPSKPRPTRPPAPTGPLPLPLPPAQSTVPRMIPRSSAVLGLADPPSPPSTPVLQKARVQSPPPAHLPPPTSSRRKTDADQSKVGMPRVVHHQPLRLSLRHTNLQAPSPGTQQSPQVNLPPSTPASAHVSPHQSRLAPPRSVQSPRNSLNVQSSQLPSTAPIPFASLASLSVGSRHPAPTHNEAAAESAESDLPTVSPASPIGNTSTLRPQGRASRSSSVNTDDQPSSAQSQSWKPLSMRSAKPTVSRPPVQPTWHRGRPSSEKENCDELSPTWSATSRSASFTLPSPEEPESFTQAPTAPLPGTPVRAPSPAHPSPLVHLPSPVPPSPATQIVPFLDAAGHRSSCPLPPSDQVHPAHTLLLSDFAQPAHDAASTRSQQPNNVCATPSPPTHTARSASDGHAPSPPQFRVISHSHSHSHPQPRLVSDAYRFLARVRTQVVSLEEEIAAKSQALEAERDAIQRERDAFKQKVDELHNALQEAKCVTLQAEKQAAAAERDMFAGRITELQRNLDNAQNQVLRSKEASLRSKFEGQRDHLRAQILSFKSEFNTSQERVRLLIIRVESLEGASTSREERMRALEDRNDFLEGRCTALETIVATLEERLAKIEVTKSSSKSDKKKRT